MERKIFNSYESRIKCNLNFERYYWQLRSMVGNTSKFFASNVGDFYIDLNCFIVPTCAI